MVRLDFQEGGCEINFRGRELKGWYLQDVIIIEVDPRLLLILLCFGFVHLFLAHGHWSLLGRELSLCRCLAVFVPWWSAGNLAAEWI